MDIKGTPGGSSEGSKKHSRESLYCFRECICNHKQNAGENMNIKGASGKDSERNEKHYWKLEDNLFYIVAIKLG